MVTVLCSSRLNQFQYCLSDTNLIYKQTKDLTCDKGIKPDNYQEIYFIPYMEWNRYDGVSIRKLLDCLSRTKIF